MKTHDPAPLERFRAQLYHGVLGQRRDALFDLVDALLTSDGPQSLVRLSLAPCFPRGWASACDALADGRLNAAALRRLCVRSLPVPAPGHRMLWALDGTTWPRPAAKTSEARTFCRFVTGGQPQEGIVPGWEYQVLAAIPEAQGSWSLPLDVARRTPESGTPTQLAVRQVRRCLAVQPAGAPRPVGVLDSHYRVHELIGAGLACDWLVRLQSNRRLFRAPPHIQVQIGHRSPPSHDPAPWIACRNRVSPMARPHMLHRSHLAGQTKYGSLVPPPRSPRCLLEARLWLVRRGPPIDDRVVDATRG